jgi:phage host-nuclease inhibitor protein Gam
MIKDLNPLAGKTRLKKPVAPVLKTRDDAEQMMHTLAAAVNHQRALTAERDAQVLAITQRYAARLAELGATVERCTVFLGEWAEANPAEFPKARKSIDMTAGTLGFRTGTPKLKLLSRAWNWDKVLAAVQATLPAFIRSKPEVDKEAILGQREELAEFLPLVGLKVDQDESFFIEPKLTEVETKQTTAA